MEGGFAIGVFPIGVLSEAMEERKVVLEEGGGATEEGGRTAFGEKGRAVEERGGAAFGEKGRAAEERGPLGLNSAPRAAASMRLTVGRCSGIIFGIITFGLAGIAMMDPGE